jgi:CheY-like chemotaxis protein
VDLSSAREYLSRMHNSAGSASPAFIVIASEADAASEIVNSLQSAHTLLKPIRRDELHKVLAAATDTASELTEPAIVAAILGGSIEGHVLLVEDEPVNAAVAEGYLTTLGCSWVWVKSGAEALARSSTERFDLILMDLSMPDLDGFATTALIRKQEGQRQRVPIVALTAHSSTDYRDRCLQAGMDDILSKPCTLEECERVLRRWMAGMRAPSDRPAGVQDDSEWTRIDEMAVRRLQNLRSSGPADLYPKLVNLFGTSSTASMEQLAIALRASDLSIAAAVCHKLASSAANVGAPAFGHKVRELEKLCAAGDATQALSLYNRLAGVLPALLSELHSRKSAVNA